MLTSLALGMRDVLDQGSANCGPWADAPSVSVNKFYGNTTASPSLALLSGRDESLQHRKGLLTLFWVVEPPSREAEPTSSTSRSQPSAGRAAQICSQAPGGSVCT